MRKINKILAMLVITITCNSCDEIIYVPNITEETVTIIAPTNAVSVSAGNVNFNWEIVDEATEYQLQIATPNFAQASQIVEEQLTTTTSFDVELVANEYEWRVRAINSAYETAYTTHSLTVE